MLRKLLVLGALSAVLASMTVSHAGSQTVNYVAGPFIRVSSPAAPVGIGGYQFTPPAKPTGVTVTDTNGPGILFTLCQENEALEGEVPGNCGGEGDDVSADFCSGGRKNIESQPFRASKPITVFVATADPTGGCPQIGTAGTLKLEW